MLEMKPLQPQDYDRVTEIYNYYILHTTVTNDTEAKTPQQMRKQIPLGEEGYHPYAMWYDGQLAGYVYLAPYSPRKAFFRTATVSIYLDKRFEGRKIGTSALRFVEQEAQKAGLHSLIAHINGKNRQSMAIFEKTGFRRVGDMVEAGFKFGEFQDTAIYQYIVPDGEGAYQK
ncbi:MAG: GNAT family N-acetyltransferase [Eubacteriales bacterium]|jgi:L-amino acid N-acyltransferase YncA